VFWQSIQPAIIILSIGIAITLVLGALATVFGSSRRMIRKQNEASAGEETALIQEMHAKLNRLESRIESLETIIVETQRKPR